jgi:hypothetical protein
VTLTGCLGNIYDIRSKNVHRWEVIGLERVEFQLKRELDLSVKCMRL